MSAADLLEFLQKEQRQVVTIEEALRLISKYEVDPVGRVMCVSAWSSIYRVKLHILQQFCLSFVQQQRRINR